MKYRKLSKQEIDHLSDLMDNHVGVPSMHELINAVYQLKGRNYVGPDAAGMWVSRSKRARVGEPGLIKLPMPEPDVSVPGGQLREFWLGWRIIEWFGEWKGIKPPIWAKRRIKKKREAYGN